MANAKSEPVNAVVNLYATFDDNGHVICPYCGESYYMQNYSVSTAAYYPPIYKDGVNINPDRNQTTTYCTCMSCKKDFSYKR